MEMAKEVFDLDLGLIDRTAEDRKYRIDIDVCDPPNQENHPEYLPKSGWTYWGSNDSLIKAMQKGILASLLLIAIVVGYFGLVIWLSINFSLWLLFLLLLTPMGRVRFGKRRRIEYE